MEGAAQEALSPTEYSLSRRVASITVVPVLFDFYLFRIALQVSS